MQLICRCKSARACLPAAVVLFPEDRSIIAVVFPTADRLKQLQAYAKTQGRLLLIINPQWRTEGQVISDFGIGEGKLLCGSCIACCFQRRWCGARVCAYSSNKAKASDAGALRYNICLWAPFARLACGVLAA